MGGGLISICFMLFMTYLSVTIFMSIFQKEKYLWDEKTIKFQKYDIELAPDNITYQVQIDPDCIENCPIFTNTYLIS